MNSLFIEASAKTALGVKEIFRELVEGIMDTPELWDSNAKAGQTTAHGNGGVPGGVQLVGGEQHGHSQDGGCAC
jgi:Ras-related protein Rab-18